MASAAPLVRSDRLNLTLMLALTFSTGVVDAVGYLGLDRVFVGNMTGNVLILGMGLAGADDLPVVGPLVALAAFAVGAIVAGAVMRGAAAGWNGRVTVVLCGVAVAHAAAAIPTGIASELTPVAFFSAVALLSVAMGAQAGIARHLAVADVPTVVITSTLVGLAFESKLGMNVPQRWRRRFFAIACMVGGAVVGALLLGVGAEWAVVAAAAITAAVAVIGGVASSGSPAASDPTLK